MQHPNAYFLDIVTGQLRKTASGIELRGPAKGQIIVAYSSCLGHGFGAVWRRIASFFMGAWASPSGCW